MKVFLDDERATAVGLGAKHDKKLSEVRMNGRESKMPRIHRDTVFEDTKRL